MMELQWFCYCSRVCDLLGFRRRKPNEEEKENPKKGSNWNLIRFEFRFAFAVVFFLHLARQGAHQGRPRRSPAMEAHVQLQILQLSVAIPRGLRANPIERRLLPDELRDGGAADPLSQPPLAPDLANRLHHHDGRLALPLLPPRRAPRALRQNGGRSRRFDSPGGGDDRALVLDPRDGEYFGGTVDWGCVGGCARGVEKDG